jgi:hypothetical protein
MLDSRPVKLPSQRDVNLWRIPLQVSLAAIVLFGVTLIPDVLDKYGGLHIPSWLTMGSIDDACAILSAMMGAVATVLALIFSVALLVLSMVATVFGPRLLYRFLQDGLDNEPGVSGLAPQLGIDFLPKGVGSVVPRGPEVERQILENLEAIRSGRMRRIHRRQAPSKEHAPTSPNHCAHGGQCNACVWAQEFPGSAAQHAHAGDSRIRYGPRKQCALPCAPP